MSPARSAPRRTRAVGFRRATWTTEIIIIPLSGWLASIFSVRRYLLVTASLFLLFSTLCGFAWNLESMIVFRAFQGLTGGALIPLSFQIILTTLPPAKRPMGFALFGVTATFAPSIGPTIGGWLTENYGWPLIFFINVVPGLVLLGSTWYAIEPRPMELGRVRDGDWWGIGTVAVGLAALTVFLEEGERQDWFGSPLIVRMAVVAVIALTAFSSSNSGWFRSPSSTCVCSPGAISASAASSTWAWG